MLEKLFKLKEHGTDVKTEVVAGLTTFMTMAYIIALNPNLLTGFGAYGQELWNAVFLATCIASAFGTILMALLANKPFAMSSGMGLNSFFAVVVANIAAIAGVSYTQGYQAGLIIILIEGIVFLILSVLNVRQKIVEAIPLGIRLGISPGIGLMLMNIGFGSNAGVYGPDGTPYYAMGNFFASLSAGNLAGQMGPEAWAAMILTVVTMFVGVFAIVALNHKGVKGSVLYGMLIASVVYWAGEFIFLGVNPFASLATASWVPPFKDMAALTLCKFDFATFKSLGVVTIVTLILTFGIIDMFDTIGTVVGTASRANMIDAEGNVPNMKEILTADAVGTIAGACTGTSTITTFIESASGVEAGGRTGLTALVTGLMFAACMFISPIAALIPAAATSSALIYVGILMLQGLANIDLSDIATAAPVFIMLLAMPISGSIGHGIGLGLISYSIIKVLTGKAKDVSALTWVISIIFLVKFFVAL
ncbi:MAG: NCS2 family permease [Erysipelotrichaceae bacterium]|nr:NCS2 family permease [Erysipelotrichaceae bacterium]